MKKKIYFIVGFIAMAGVFQSCSDSYLEEENPNTISSDIYWSNLTESDANLTSVYGAMLNNYLYSVDFEAWRSDLAFPKDRDLPYELGMPWYNKSYNNNVKDFEKSWNAMYQVIFRANQVIEGLNGMTADLKSQKQWTEQMAQARFFRGLMHFYMHSNYNQGRIVIRDKNPVKLEEFSKKLSSSSEVLKFFRDDLLYAYNNLPDKFDQKSRVTAGTAAMVLGKSFLYTKEYDDSMFYLKKVIGNPAYGYQLLKGDNVKLLFTGEGDFNSESILEINYSAVHQTQEGTFDEESFFNRFARYFAPAGTIKGQASVVPSAWLTYAYQSEELDSQDARNYVDNGTGGKKLRNVPLRASQYVALVNDEQSKYYKAATANELVTFGGTTFSYFKKFTNHDIVASEQDILETGFKSGKNLVIYRLADAYLMQAECLTQTNDLEGAKKLINEIRMRWGLMLLGEDDGSGHDFDEEIYTQASLMEHIMHVERPLELSCEGYAERSVDLRRWGISKKRYQDLALLDFNLIDYTTQKGIKRSSSLLQKGLSADPSNLKISIKEYTDAAANYNTGLNDYLPLPISEVLYNQNSK
ncbi:RagB/SusD family nutrient uptake outer membrane protein [Flavobacterium ovatum]|uniref:RagB/SusD family nutrient uptake outer membrane protein n=1 Tax=Flavobacterium ovatum TaxID=1928857 RepID=UPI00344D8EC7